MDNVSGDGFWLSSKNPFPAAAVARISDLRPDVPTIETAAVHEVDTLVDSYLSDTRVATAATKAEAQDQLANAGKIVVIEGEYGTGKTHLAMEILDRIEQARLSSGTDTRIIYQVAPGGTFLTLYTDLMRKVVTSEEILGRVQEFYADIVATAVRERSFAEELALRLEDGDVDPLLVVERFGLMEGTLRQELRQRLSAVTGDEAFSSALMLLLQPALRQSVWRWLCGGTPDQIIAERGISEPIETDESALEALGVLALLYGRKNRRFVLVIDEMEKLALTWDRSPEASGQAFKKLLEVFKAAGALLVSIGLPEIFDFLPKDPGRIDAVIRPPMLTDGEARWYIEETFQRAFQSRTLGPFDEESIRYLVYISRGVARDVVKLCYQAYEQASATGEEVTTTTIKSVAHVIFPSGSTDMLRREIGEMLLDDGWDADRNRVLGRSADSRVDFWVAVGPGGDGCAIVVSDAVLDERDVKRLERRSAAIQSDSPHRELILVVNGYLAADMLEALAAVFEYSILYEARSFDREFTQALKAAIGRIDPGLDLQPAGGFGVPEIRALREETQRIGRQQSSTLRLVRELADRVAEVSETSDARLNGIKRALEVGSGGLPGGDRALSPKALPASLEELFDAARRSLAAYGDMHELMEEIFGTATEEPDAGARFSLTYRLRGSEVYTPIGIATFLADLVTSFHQSIAKWLDSLGTGDRQGMSDFEGQQLREICQTYDSLYAVVPLFHLDPLPELTGSAEHEGRISRSDRSSRRQRLQDAFDQLGDRVYRIASELAIGENNTSPTRVAN